MNIVIATLVFCIVLFIYIHIYFHIKTSDDLEIYEIEQPSKDKLEEICDIRQPVVFDFYNERLNSTCNLNTIHENYGVFDVKVRNLLNNDDAAEHYIPITLNSAIELFKNDNDKKYVIEKNADFLEETGLIKCYMYNDAFLRPYMVSSCNYDLLSGTNGTTSLFKYDINYRNFYLVTQGNIKVKMAPPKSSRYLYPITDYENFEFSSPVNPWHVQMQYKADFDKIKCLEINLKPGSMLFIPAFWWYSFEFNNNASVCSFKYRTYMNTIANGHHFFMSFLQGQNVKRNMVKHLDLINNKTQSAQSDDVTQPTNQNGHLDATILRDIPISGSISGEAHAPVS
jgi:hypothetical protein